MNTMKSVLDNIITSAELHLSWHLELNPKGTLDIWMMCGLCIYKCKRRMSRLFRERFEEKRENIEEGEHEEKKRA